jgi:hypothetical protein
MVELNLILEKVKNPQTDRDRLKIKYKLSGIIANITFD